MACCLDGAKPLSEPMLDLSSKVFCDIYIWDQFHKKRLWTSSIINWTLRNKFQWNFNRNSNIVIQGNAFENVVWKMAAILSRPQWVNGDITLTWMTSKHKISIICNIIQQKPHSHIIMPKETSTHTIYHDFWEMYLKLTNQLLFSITYSLYGKLKYILKQSQPAGFHDEVKILPLTKDQQIYSFDIFFIVSLHKPLYK